MRWITMLALATLALMALAPAAALADGPAATSIRIAVPPNAQLGEAAEVQAQLVDSGGKPVADAVVLFTAPLGFLESSGDVVLADARTDTGGIAATEIDLRTEGALAVTAVFKGDAQHAGSSATATIDVAGTAQLYAQGAGVKLPGLNTAPTAPGTNAMLVGGLASLWPRLSGWPVALVLMIVWSLYASVVVTLFRITAASRKAGA
jgi:hypothetical protein